MQVETTGQTRLLQLLDAVWMVLMCRVDALYSFFVQWSPNVTGDGEVSVNDRGFVVLQSADSGSDGAAPATTDSTELAPTNHPGRVWHVSPPASGSPLLIG